MLSGETWVGTAVEPGLQGKAMRVRVEDQFGTWVGKELDPAVVRLGTHTHSSR